MAIEVPNLEPSAHPENVEAYLNGARILAQLDQANKRNPIPGQPWQPALESALAGRQPGRENHGGGISSERQLWWCAMVGRRCGGLAAGQIANRNLTLDKWNQHFSEEPYRRTFPDLPGPPDVLPHDEKKGHDMRSRWINGNLTGAPRDHPR